MLRDLIRRVPRRRFAGTFSQRRTCRRMRVTRPSPMLETLEPRHLLAAVIQEDFPVPDAIAAFNALADSADLLAYNYFNAETLPLTLPPGDAPTEPRDGDGPNTPAELGENTSDEHYQGIARSFGIGTAYLYESGSGSDLDDPDDFPDTDKSPEPRANLLISRIASAPTDGERLGPNRFTERVSSAPQAPIGNPPAEDRIVNNIFFDDYGHIGGLDTAGQILAVSLERALDANFQRTDDPAMPHGVVRFLDISDPVNPAVIPGIEVIPSFFSNIYDGASGEVGVVALARLKDGTFLLALSAKRGEDVLFYRSNGTDFFAPGFNFGPLVTESISVGANTISAPYQTTRPFDVLTASSNNDNGRETIGPANTFWPVNYTKSFLGVTDADVPASHQNFNFITEANGNLFLIGSRNDCGGSTWLCPSGNDADDWIDLYRVSLQTQKDDPQRGTVTLSLITSREVETKEGHFAHVGGSHVTPTGELLYYSGDGYNHEDSEASRIDVGELRSRTMSTGTTSIRGVVATTPDGVFTKTSRAGNGRFLEAGNTLRTTVGDEMILQVRPGETIDFYASVLQAWVEFFESDNPRTNQLLVEIDDRHNVGVLSDFGNANDTNNSEFNDDAEFVSYWLPRGTMVELYEDGISDSDPTKIDRLIAPSVVVPGANDVIYRSEIDDDVKGEVTAMRFIRAGQAPGRSSFDFPNFESLTTIDPRFKWSSSVVSGETTPIEKLMSPQQLDSQQLSVAFDQPGRVEITVQYLPAGGLIRDVTGDELLKLNFPALRGSNVASDWATLTMTIDVIDNFVPVAAADNYQTTQGVPLTVPAPGVLGNDTDGDGDVLTAILDKGPANGTVTLNADGSFTYTPNANFSGSDVFVYHANDGQVESDKTEVNIIVSQIVNTPPVAVEDAYLTTESVELFVAAPGVLGNDADDNGDALTAILEEKPTDGKLDLNPDGSFVYSPNPGFVGLDSFSYRTNDGELNSTPVAVEIKVNPAARLLGDFNLDGVLDSLDIDDLTRQSAAQQHPLDPYDLTEDGKVDRADVRFWAYQAFGTWLGDANLDGEFTTQDLIGTLAANTYEQDVDAVWSTGDFNGDGRFDTGDLIDALADNGYERGPYTG